LVAVQQLMKEVSLKINSTVKFDIDIVTFPADIKKVHNKYKQAIH